MNNPIQAIQALAELAPHVEVVLAGASISEVRSLLPDAEWVGDVMPQGTLGNVVVTVTGGAA